MSLRTVSFGVVIACAVVSAAGAQEAIFSRTYVRHAPRHGDEKSHCDAGSVHAALRTARPAREISSGQ